MRLTLQLQVGSEWGSAATLEVPSPGEGSAGPCNVEYDVDWLQRWIGEERPDTSVSLTYPVQFGPLMSERWPAFLDDLRPMGASHRWWLRRLNLPDDRTSDAEVLRRGTIAPIGNARILEAVPARAGAPPRFPRQALIDRGHDFLEWAAEQGAHVGGATGAGGDSPKLLVRCDASDRIWIDVWQDDAASPDKHFLVKFARRNTDRDRLILRSEHVYYRALAELGIETIDTSGLSLQEGEAGPSLWLPRFDVEVRDGRTVRWGMESVYALLHAEPASWLSHQQALGALRQHFPTESWPELLVEYLRRDLLNLVFGNSDNHGRNTAVLRTDSGVRLAPVYDFAPMKLDLDGITRTTRWEGFERGGEVDWPGLLQSFEDVPEERLREGLRPLAHKLVDLRDRLHALGLPEETLTFPALGLADTARKLRDWTLL